MFRSLVNGFQRRRISGDKLAELSIVSGLKEKQDQDPISLELKAYVYKQRELAFEQMGDCVIIYKGRECVPMVIGLQEMIIQKAHTSTHSIHPDSKKMYPD